MYITNLWEKFEVHRVQEKTRSVGVIGPDWCGYKNSIDFRRVD
jgi:hypothetical protein